MVVVSSTFSAPAEGVLYQSPSTKLLVNDEELGTATLYITEQNVVWGGGVTPAGIAAPTVTLLYPNISLHAVQREPTAALYMVLNHDLRLPGLTTQQQGAGDENEDEDFDPDNQPITQLRFVPQNEAELQPMFAAMNQGQSLHPDPQDEIDEEEPYMDGEEFEDGEGGDEEFEDAEGEGGGDDAANRLRQMRLDHANGHNYEDAEDADIAEE